MYDRLYGKREIKLNMKKLWQSIKAGQMKSSRVNLIVLFAIDSLNYWILYLSVTFMMDYYWNPEKGVIRMLTGGILVYFITLIVIIRTYHLEIKFTGDLLQIVRYDRGEISIKIADIQSMKFVENDEVLFGNQCEITLLIENQKKRFKVFGKENKVKLKKLFEYVDQSANKTNQIK